MNKTDIVKDVRIILDQNEVTEGFLTSDISQLGLDEIIETQILPAARMAEMMAPTEMTDWTNQSEYLTLAETNTRKLIAVERGFIKFGSLKMKDSPVTINELSTVDSKAYKKQFLGFDGLKASATLPIAVYLENVVVEKPDHTRYNGAAIEVFGGNTYAPLDYCSLCYAPTDTSTTLAIGKQLEQPMEYICAALVAEVLKDTDKSNQLMQIAKNLMTIQDDKTQS